jgi:hypothetical protein
MPSQNHRFWPGCSVSAAQFSRGMTDACAGTRRRGRRSPVLCTADGGPMYSIVYLVGLVVIVLAILSFIGLR